MKLNNFPSYEELRKKSPEILKIVETSIKPGTIVEISGYPGTGKTLVSSMMFSQCQNTKKIFLTYGNLLCEYTKMPYGQNKSIMTFDSYLYEFGKKINRKEINAISDQKLKKEERYKKRMEQVDSLNSKFSDGNIVFIDEAQDIDYDILAKFSLHFDSIVICGDKNQTIYDIKNAGKDFFREFDTALKKYDPNFEEKYRFKNPDHLYKNFRNTKPIFAFAKCFQPESKFLEKIEIMREGGEKPEIRTGTNQAIFTNMVKLCTNALQEQKTVGIIIEHQGIKPLGKQTHDLVDRVYEQLTKELKSRINDFKTEYISQYHSKCKDVAQAKKCVNAGIVVTTTHSAKGLEFDYVIFDRRINDGWNDKDSTIKNLYYVCMTRAKDKLIICQNDSDFGKYQVPSELYNVIQWKEELTKREEKNDSSDFDDIVLPF